ncbi:acyl-CoA dehydrogenase family protein [Streptomyces sp. RY43-2]|uniref:Acyl-CoA dehydrogenase family protein n=1 Tax=Streptomyces macrolidinus TaxID=2952607 RepID=A0ABT0ZKJ7_9ACTN|nr:acyl-CoA dehydrogenase family protein [Streptomyces macrolidinus]MCN9244086.1 acyl-CoA dehydrogenase family protein [Streptomyces macrolidinus]
MTEHAWDTVTGLIDGQADDWDRAGLLPVDLLRKLGADGRLCAQVPAEYGGRGLSSLENGEFTARVGSLCSSVRSVMTSQGMAAWTIERLGTAEQRAAWLPRLTGGELAAAGFSEPGAGSDLSAIATSIRRDGDSVVIDGRKVWVTAAHYADLLVVFGRYEDGAAAVVVPSDAPGVRVERVADPLGCRAAGHAGITLDSVRLPADAVLGGVGLSLPLLVTTALAYGRISVAWGCVGILRGCRTAAAQHASTREQFGKPLAEHQLVARHLAELLVAEQLATRVSEHASRCWDSGSPEQVMATVLAKHVSADQATRGAETALQVLASAGARDGHLVARAYRDAKLMKIIEGSHEMCQLMLAEHAVNGSI